VAVADFNNDGLVDVAVAHSLPNVPQYWQRNQANFNLSFASPSDVGTCNGGASKVAAGDLDDDGDTDLVYACYSMFQTSPFKVCENRLSLGWNCVDIDERITKANLLQLVDLDGDGLLDILAQFDSKLVRYKNKGGLAFRLYDAFLPFRQNGQLTTTAVDFDRDGDLDVISADIAAREVYYHRNRGVWNFDAPELLVGQITAALVIIVRPVA
jgi:hypothetical protein